MINILVAEDELIMLKAIERELSNSGYCVKVAKDGAEALDLFLVNSFDIILLDIQMPNKTGLELLKEIRSFSKDPTVIMITGFASIESAVESIKLGADDYVTKPYDINELLDKVHQYARIKQNNQGIGIYEENLKSVFFGDNILMKKIKDTIEKVKDLNTTLLITGESGTGKSLIAKEIHRKSNRKESPFVHVDCAILPDNLIESELFGYEKGAFTGAIASKKGKFESAGNGTIFLDEIGTLSINLQAKLLNTLQEKTITRIGGTVSIPYEARIIAATNEDLEERVRNKTFRGDLYYRLNVVRIEAVPLRYHKDDIFQLSKLFINRFSKNMDKTIKKVDDKFWDLLNTYDWPGNVRELENVLESAVALCEGTTLTGKDLPIRITKNKLNNGDSPENNVLLSLKQQELVTIMAALEKFDGHREKTAQYLGISRRTLQYKLKKYNIK